MHGITHLKLHVVKHNYTFITKVYYCLAVQGKAIPVQEWTVSEVSRRLKFPYFKAIGT
jgi:hypothetical protein